MGNVAEEIVPTESGLRSVSGDQARNLVMEHGVRFPFWRLVTNPDSAVETARAIGEPVVLKTAAADIVHKSDAGCVRLDLSTESEVRNAWSEIVGNACRAGSATPDHVIVERAEKGIAEFVIGLKRSEIFGPVIMVGVGGIWVEVMRDYALRLCPVSRDEASGMLTDLRAFPILAGGRNQEPCDLDAIADMIVVVSRLGIEREDIHELDLNPVIAMKAGHGAVSVDARVVLRNRASD